MKLSKVVLRTIVTVLGLAVFVVGCDAWVKAEGDGWSFEAKASTSAEVRRK